MIGMASTDCLEDLHSDSAKDRPEPGRNTAAPLFERFKALWIGWRGICVMAFGVVIPSLIIAACALTLGERAYHLLLRHPLETLVEIALVILVPVANYRAWSAVTQGTVKGARRHWLLAGLAAGTSLTCTAISLAPFLIRGNVLDGSSGELKACLMVLAATSLPAFISSAYVIARLALIWQTQSARTGAILTAALSALLAVAAFAGAEARPAYIRFAEQMATSSNAERRQAGAQILRSLGVERELRLQCADPRAAGIAGLFFPVDPAKEKQLYFYVTGKPYRNNLVADLSALSDDDLWRHAVGPRIEGLALARSALAGVVHPDSLSSTIEWTLVLDNETWDSQEARVVLTLPHEAVVSGLSVWVDGIERKSATGATDRVSTAGGSFYSDSRDLALLTDLGNGRVLLTCGSVAPQSQLKVRVSVTAPLTLNNPSEAAMNLPRLVASNFAVSGDDHLLRLRSSDWLSVSLPDARGHRSTSADRYLSCSMTQKDIAESRLTLTAGRHPDLSALAAHDPYSSETRFVVQTIDRTAEGLPERLLIVVDGSGSMKHHADELRRALSRIPSNISASIVIASEQATQKLVPLADGLTELSKVEFAGGQDNLHALLKAAEEAGSRPGGAVLWIHGPQSDYNRQIYIMAPYASHPSFFEYADNNGWSENSEFLKNHREVGPMVAVEQTGDMEADLMRFFLRWKRGSDIYDVAYARLDKSFGAVVADKIQAEEISRLSANQECLRLIARGNYDRAAKIAVRYGLVTPATSAVVLANASDYSRFGISGPVESQNSYKDITDPRPEPDAENPQIRYVYANAGGATVVIGVNSAGTVRVNNLANLEALLNIIANGIEILGIGLGFFNIVMGWMKRPMCVPFSMKPRARIGFGIAVIVVAFMAPGFINWLVASARDANLFT